jgi:hypothetical protein
MSSATIAIPAAMLAAVRRHLLPPDGECEEAAFLFALATQAAGSTTLQVADHFLVPPECFVRRSAFYLELNDDTRARVLKIAHDLGAGLIEAHSHPGQRRACFSWSDLHGFDEFVPHVRWRLAKRPYAAVVFTPDSFDALAWIGDGENAAAVHAMQTETETHRPTGLTIANWKEIYDYQPI